MHLQWGNYEKRLVKSSNGFLRNENGTRNECQVDVNTNGLFNNIHWGSGNRWLYFALLRNLVFPTCNVLAGVSFTLRWVRGGRMLAFPFTQLRFFFAAFLRVAQNENVGMDLNSQIIPCCHLAQVARFMTLAFWHFFCHFFCHFFAGDLSIFNCCKPNWVSHFNLNLNQIFKVAGQANGNGKFNSTGFFAVRSCCDDFCNIYGNFVFPHFPLANIVFSAVISK